MADYTPSYLSTRSENGCSLRKLDAFLKKPAISSVNCNKSGLISYPVSRVSNAEERFPYKTAGDTRSWSPLLLVFQDGAKGEKYYLRRKKITERNISMTFFS